MRRRDAVGTTSQSLLIGCKFAVPQSSTLDIHENHVARRYLLRCTCVGIWNFERQKLGIPTFIELLVLTSRSQLGRCAYAKMGLALLLQYARHDSLHCPHSAAALSQRRNAWERLWCSHE
jgi:hypothetical protein